MTHELTKKVMEFLLGRGAFPAQEWRNTVLGSKSWLFEMKYGWLYDRYKYHPGFYSPNPTPEDKVLSEIFYRKIRKLQCYVWPSMIDCFAEAIMECSDSDGLAEIGPFGVNVNKTLSLVCQPSDVKVYKTVFVSIFYIENDFYKVLHRDSLSGLSFYTGFPIPVSSSKTKKEWLDSRIDEGHANISYAEENDLFLGPMEMWMSRVMSEKMCNIDDGEGGKQIARMLFAYGITDFAKLFETTPDDFYEIFAPKFPQFRNSLPEELWEEVMKSSGFGMDWFKFCFGVGKRTSDKEFMARVKSYGCNMDILKKSLEYIE